MAPLHGIGGSNRKSEGFYGEKTGQLVIAAYEKLLPDAEPAPFPRGDLVEALRAEGAPVGP